MVACPRTRGYYVGMPPLRAIAAYRFASISAMSTLRLHALSERSSSYCSAFCCT